MAFDNVTFFEVHLDGLSTGSTASESTDVGTGAESVADAATPARKGTYLALIALATVVGVVLARRRRSDGDSGRGIDVDAPDETTAPESATA